MKEKNVVNTAVSKTSVITIAPGMFNINLEPLPPRLLKNKDPHIDYIKHSKENVDILRDLVKNDRALNPLNSNLNTSCKYAHRIQEVLVYVQKACPCLSTSSGNLVAETPKKNDKKVRFADPDTSSCNPKKQVTSHKPRDSNQPLLHPTGVVRIKAYMQYKEQ
nr:hypothetical protein [Tanacetum cinerariifolium]